MGEILAQPLVAIIVLLGVLIFVHELGHYLVGKMCGIGVEIFSIGFGPTLFSFTHKHTIYRIAIFPLGGFVKFAGAHPSEPVPEHFIGKEMINAPAWARALTLIAGPFANLTLAVAIFSWMAVSGIPHPPAIVGQVMPGSAAQEAGMKSGDKIMSIDGRKIVKWDDFRDAVSASAGKKLLVEVVRGGQSIEMSLVPKASEGKSLFGKSVQVGRAGIGLGLVPAIVTLAGSDSYVGKQAGLQTGDEILAIKIEGKGQLVVGSWPELSELVFQAFKEGQRKIVLVLQRQDQKLEQTLSLDRAWSADEQIDAETFAEALGWTHSALTLKEVQAPAAEVLQPADRILEAALLPTKNIYDLSEVLQKNTSSRLSMTIERQGQKLNVEVHLGEEEVQRPQGKETIYLLKVQFLGQLLQPEPYIERYPDFLSALLYGTKRCWEESTTILSTLWGLITGVVPVQVLGGPIMIAQVAKHAASEGIFSFLLAMSLISINLGVLNLMPIPFLDGGQLLLVAVQALRRKSLSEMAIENFHKVGFVMVLALMVLATYNDLNRFWASMIKSMIGFFDK